MILDQVNVDWITLTTWDLPIFFRTVAWLRGTYVGGWKPAKVMQYGGQSNGEVFYGTAEQMNGQYEKKGHGFIRVSGLESAVFFSYWKRFELARHESWKCTRIDLESTKRPPDEDLLRTCYKRLAEPKEWHESPNRTLGIGNRAESPIYVRIYEKLQYLRCELELKQGRSTWAYQELMRGTDMRDIWHSALKKSRVPKYYFDHFDQWADGQRLAYELEKADTDMERKLAWLTSLSKTVELMLADHTIGERTQDLLNSWIESLQ